MTPARLCSGSSGDRHIGLEYPAIRAILPRGQAHVLSGAVGPFQDQLYSGVPVNGKVQFVLHLGGKFAGRGDILIVVDDACDKEVEVGIDLQSAGFGVWQA